MKTEFEVRFLEINVKGIEDKLNALGAKEIGNWKQKRNTYDLIPKKENSWLRLRNNGEKTTLTVKEILTDKIDGTKELEIEVNDFDETALILRKIGLQERNYQENKRPFHNFGNTLVKKLVNLLFKNDIRDIMTGYRAFSYQFVKSYPVLSKGFEIETEMSIHAIDKNMMVENVVIAYRDRPSGSESKLNTYADGYKVVRTILRLYKDFRPMAFFGMICALLSLTSFAFFLPVLIEYLKTGWVMKFPTLIVCGFVMIAALMSLFTGVILNSLRHKDRQIFEYLLHEIRFRRKH